MTHKANVSADLDVHFSFLTSMLDHESFNQTARIDKNFSICEERNLTIRRKAHQAINVPRKPQRTLSQQSFTSPQLMESRK